MKVTKEYLQQVINEEIQLMVEEGEIDEGILDRIGARVGSAFQGVKGGIKSAGASLVGKAGGMIDPKLGAAGAKVAADIKAGTAAKQKAVKIKQVVLPKVIDLQKDIQIIFKDMMNDPQVQEMMNVADELKNKVSQITTSAGLAGRNPKAPAAAPETEIGSRAVDEE